MSESGGATSGVDPPGASQGRAHCEASVRARDLADHRGSCAPGGGGQRTAMVNDGRRHICSGSGPISCCTTSGRNLGRGAMAELEKPGIAMSIDGETPSGDRRVLRNLVGGCRGRPDRPTKAAKRGCALLPARKDCIRAPRRGMLGEVGNGREDKSPRNGAEKLFFTCPDELPSATQSSSEVAQQLPTNCRTVALGATLRPNLDPHWPVLDTRWLFGGRFDQTLASFDQTWPTLAKCWLTLTDSVAKFWRPCAERVASRNISHEQTVSEFGNLAASHKQHAGAADDLLELVNHHTECFRRERAKHSTCC